MKAFLKKRGAEERTLRANIEKAEKRTDSMQNAWGVAAKKRMAANEKALQSADGKESAAKKKYAAKLNVLNKQYKSKVNVVLQKAIKGNKRAGKPFKDERDRTYEFSAFTKDLLRIKANAYSAKGMKRLENGDIAEARKEFFKALYIDTTSKTGLNGLKAIDKTAKKLYNKAYKLITDDVDSAKKILLSLKRDLDPFSEYYLKTLALIEEAKMQE